MSTERSANYGNVMEMFRAPAYTYYDPSIFYSDEYIAELQALSKLSREEIASLSRPAITELNKGGFTAWQELNEVIGGKPFAKKHPLQVNFMTT